MSLGTTRVTKEVPVDSTERWALSEALARLYINGDISFDLSRAVEILASDGIRVTEEAIRMDCPERGGMTTFTRPVAVNSSIR